MLDARKPSALLLALLVLLALAGCGEESDSGSGTDPSPPDLPTATTSPDGSGAIPDLPQNENPSAVRCTGPPRGVFDATEVIGEPIAPARRAARSEGCSIRVVERDGRPLAATDDFRPDRVNVATEQRLITRILSLG